MWELMRNYEEISQDNFDKIKYIQLPPKLLKIFPNRVLQFVNLHTLSICSNLLTSLPQELTQLQHLNIFEAPCNKFSEFPAILCEITSLVDINLDRNQITSIPPTISRLTALNRLMLSNNRLRAIPELALMKLVTFMVSRNEITIFPRELCQLTSLRHLFLNNNQISAIPEEITYLISLEILSLSKNQIRELPDNLALTSLESIDMRKNPICNFPSGLLCNRLKDIHWGLFPVFDSAITINKNPQIYDDVSIINIGLFEYFEKYGDRCWVKSAHKFAHIGTKRAILAIMMIALDESSLFHKLPREILLYIFTWLPFYGNHKSRVEAIKKEQLSIAFSVDADDAASTSSTDE